MARYALIKDGVVDHVIIIDADKVLLLPEDSPIGKGDFHDENTGEFTKDPMVVARDLAATKAREAEISQQGE